MNAKVAIAQVMTADAPLMALLTGGVYTDAELTPGMAAPNPFDEYGRMKPSALLRNEAVPAVGPRGRFEQPFVLVFFYDYAGYEVINQAMARAKVLLHERWLGGSAYEVRHTDDTPDWYDDALLAFMRRSRFTFTRMRGEA